jgi:hypothetical protein
VYRAQSKNVFHESGFPMSTLLTSAIISKETLMNFENELVFANKADWSYSDKFANPTDQIGNSYTFRKPINVLATDDNLAWVAANSTVQENAVTIFINRTLTVPLSFTEGDLALKMEKFADRIINPATRVLAAKADTKFHDSIINSTVPGANSGAGLTTGGLSTATAVPNYAGYTIGTYAGGMSVALVAKAKKILMDQGCPVDSGDLWGILSTTAHMTLSQAQQTVFQPLIKIDEIYRKGVVGNLVGISFAVSQSLVAHTTGTTPTIAPSAGSAASGWTETVSLTVAGMSGTANPGDVFQCPSTGPFIVNPLTKVITDTPFQVQVISVTDSTHIVVGPAPIHAGQYQNISATLNGITLSLVGAATPGVASESLTGVESIIFHKKAIQAACIEFTIPKKSSMDMAESIKGDDVEGFKFRFLRGYDMIGASAAFGGGVGTGGPGFISRLDAGYGIKTSQPAWIVRILS